MISKFCKQKTPANFHLADNGLTCNTVLLTADTGMSLSVIVLEASPLSSPSKLTNRRKNGLKNLVQG